MESQPQIVALLTGALPNSRTPNFSAGPGTEQPDFDRFFQKELSSTPPVESSPPAEPARNQRPKVTPKGDSAPRNESKNPRVESETSNSKPPVEDSPRPSQRPDPITQQNSPVAGETVHQETPQQKPAPTSNPIHESTPVATTSESTPATPLAAEVNPRTQGNSVLLEGLLLNEPAILERLQNLGVPQETLDILANAFENAEPGFNKGLIQALQGLLRAPETIEAPTRPVEGLPAPAPFPKAGVPQQLALEALTQLGLEETEAQELIGQIRAALTAKLEGNQRTLRPRAPVTAEGAKVSEGEVAKTLDLPVPPPAPTTPREPTPNSFLKGPEFASGADPNNEAVNSQSPQDKGLHQLQQVATALTGGKGSSSSTGYTLNNLGTQPGSPTVDVSTPAAGASANAVDSTGKSAEALRPAQAETYSPRATVVKSVTAQIVEKFSIRGMGTQREIQIRLEPPSLGTVRMNVTSSGESVRTTIVAENQMVKQVIENNLTQLKDSITSQGMKVADFTVLVGGQSQQNTPHQRGEDVKAFRPFDPMNVGGNEGVEESVGLRGRYFFSETQSISLFA